MVDIRTKNVCCFVGSIVCFTSLLLVGAVFLSRYVNYANEYQNAQVSLLTNYDFVNCSAHVICNATDSVKNQCYILSFVPGFEVNHTFYNITDEFMGCCKLPKQIDEQCNELLQIDLNNIILYVQNVESVYYLKANPTMFISQLDDISDYTIGIISVVLGILSLCVLCVLTCRHIADNGCN